MSNDNSIYRWVKATSDNLPMPVDGKTKVKFVNAEMKKYGGGTYMSNRMAYYFPEHYKTVEWEDWDDYSEEDFPYTENDAEKGVVWLRPGWYELVNCENCEDHWNSPLNVIEWLEEIKIEPGQQDELWKEVKSVLTKNTYTQYYGEDEKVRIVKPQAIEQLSSLYTIIPKLK